MTEFSGDILYVLRPDRSAGPVLHLVTTLFFFFVTLLPLFLTHHAVVTVRLLAILPTGGMFFLRFALEPRFRGLSGEVSTRPELSLPSSCLCQLLPTGPHNIIHALLVLFRGEGPVVGLLRVTVVTGVIDTVVVPGPQLAPVSGIFTARFSHIRGLSLTSLVLGLFFLR